MRARTVHGVSLVEDGDMVFPDFERRGWPSFEPTSMAAWLEAVRPDATAIDVGAYTGLYAIAAARAGADVIALEPNATAYDRLLQNAKANGVTLRAKNLAAGAVPGMARVSRSGTLSSAASVSPDPTGPVHITRLDDLVITRPVSAIKVDVEGMEPEVLMGALSTLHKDRPVLILEAHTERDVERITAVTNHMGYRFRRADERNIIGEA